MIDRFGNHIKTEWRDHEVLWLAAALTLPDHDRLEAFEEISDLTHRTMSAIKSKAFKIKMGQEEARLARIIAGIPDEPPVEGALIDMPWRLRNEIAALPGAPKFRIAVGVPRGRREKTVQAISQAEWERCAACDPASPVNW